jgi:hypothetical protein
MRMAGDAEARRLVYQSSGLDKPRRSPPTRDRTGLRGDRQAVRTIVRVAISVRTRIADALRRRAS